MTPLPSPAIFRAMQIIAPDLLADVRELPPLALVVVMLVGLCLWSAGWWAHRFWVVLGTTLAAGLMGLRLAPHFGVQPIVAGLLAAIAAGGLALALVRVAVFAGCGLGCWYLVQLLSPQWAEPVVCILTGGLLGVLFFRFWMILLTSAVGTLLASYGGLVLAESVVGLDVVQWVSANGGIVLVGFAGAVFLGIVIQYLIERARKRHQRLKEDLEELHRAQVQEFEEKRWWPRFPRAA